MSYPPQARPDDGALLYGCKGIGSYLGLTENEVWTLCNKGDLPHFRIGRRLCARPATLDRWLESLEEESGHAA